MPLKKIFITLGVLLFAGSVYAVPVSWDKTGVILQPLRSSWTDEVKIPYLTATTTTATSTFNGGFVAALGIRLSLFTSCTALESDSNGYIQCGSDADGYSFTPTANLGVTMSATTSNILALGAGFYASSTSIFSTTTVQGALNIGTLTATSGTSFVNQIRTPNGSVSSPSYIVGAGAAGMYLVSSGSLGFTNGTNGLTWDGTNFFPNTTLVHSLGKVTNLWNALYVNSATTSNFNCLATCSFGSTATSSFTAAGNLFVAASSTINGFLYHSGNSTTTGTAEVTSGQLVNRAASTTGMTASYTVDWNSGTHQRIDLVATTFLDINSTSSHPYDGGKYTLEVCQGGTAYAASFTGNGAAHRWGGGNGATTSINTTALSADKCQMLGAIYNGTYSRYRWVASSTPYAR